MQAWHLRELVFADPFRPFKVTIAAGRAFYVVNDPKTVRFRGDVMVLRDGDVDVWINPGLIAIIEVYPA